MIDRELVHLNASSAWYVMTAYHRTLWSGAAGLARHTCGIDAENLIDEGVEIL